MRRKDREIADRSEILAIVNRCDVCHVAFADGNEPYVVPMNFAMLEEEGRLVLCFHCAGEGRKLDMMDRNPRVAFSMSTGHTLEWQENGSCTMRYESVCGTGTMRRAEPEEKLAALNAIMEHYRPEYGRMPGGYPEAQLQRTTILKLTVEEISGKRSAPKARGNGDA